MQKMTCKFALKAAGVVGFAQLAFVTAFLSSAVAEDWQSDQPIKQKILDNKSYNPIQAITYELGANKLSAYFQRINGKCAMTLMLFKNIDPAAGVPDSAPSRVQLSVSPGEQARIDSEGEGVKLNCNGHAATVTAVHFDNAPAVDISQNVQP